MAEISDSQVSLRLRHGVHTIHIFAESKAPFSDISKDLVEILRERYPNGLTTSLEPPRKTDVPPAGETVRFAYGVLIKPDDVSQGWRRVEVGNGRSDGTPKQCGLGNNSLVAFMLIGDKAGGGGDEGADDVVFQVEWPTMDEAMYEP